jgi:hypothetical protein
MDSEDAPWPSERGLARGAHMLRLFGASAPSRGPGERNVGFRRCHCTRRPHCVVTPFRTPMTASRMTESPAGFRPVGPVVVCGSGANRFLIQPVVTWTSGNQSFASSGSASPKLAHDLARRTADPPWTRSCNPVGGSARVSQRQDCSHGSGALPTPVFLNVPETSARALTEQRCVTANGRVRVVATDAHTR